MTGDLGCYGEERAKNKKVEFICEQLYEINGKSSFREWSDGRLERFAFWKRIKSKCCKRTKRTSYTMRSKMGLRTLQLTLKDKYC
jgi:hypothetical protein